MSTALKRYTVEEYLTRERDSETKHEFYDGEIFAMAGASKSHNLVALNIASELRNALRERECLALPSDMRIVCPTGLYTYPDASVVCGPADVEAIGGLDTLKNPLMIVEVLSKSTEAFDRGRKFDHYKTILSLRGYLLLWQDRPRADHYAQQDDGSWLLRSVEGMENRITLPELDVTLSLGDLYAKVNFPAPEDETDDLLPEADAVRHPRSPIP